MLLPYSLGPGTAGLIWLIFFPLSFFFPFFTLNVVPDPTSDQTGDMLLVRQMLVPVSPLSLSVPSPCTVLFFALTCFCKYKKTPKK